MKRIIVATDFSASAFNAALYAAEMAKSINGYVILLHVCQLPLSATELPVVVNAADLANDAERFMEDEARRLTHRTRELVMFETVVRTGGFYHELQLLCEKEKPYAVVMGCQGTTTAERLFFGDHVVPAMKHLAWPVIAVPPEARFSTIKKVALASDFEDVSANTPVEELKVLVKDFNAKLYVLNTGGEHDRDAEMVYGSHRLHQMLESLRPTYHFVKTNNTDEAIVEFADKHHIDLLIILPKRHGVIEKLLFKSHTRQLVLHSHVPVMTLSPGKHAAAN